MNELDNFEIWNKKKQNLHFNSTFNAYPKIGEVWVAAVGKNIGFEQNGKGYDFQRPVLIIKKFNNHMMWIVPLTSIPKSLDFYYNYTDHDGNKVAAILAQLKLMSTKRLYRRSYRISKVEFSRIIKALQNMLDT